MPTPYHACYFAHELTRRHSSAGVERLSMSLFDARVDLNPHQINAAIFALYSPLFKAVILADEVGLGKTIEAGLILCQYRAERRDLVIIDEAHRLRNAYRPSNKTGWRLRWTLEDRRKVLLTATPLQNSLLEPYGLSIIIDDYIFGDSSAFCSQYMRQDSDEAVSGFLKREYTYSIPMRRRSLTTLVLRRLLASSSRAITGALQTMKARLATILEQQHAIQLRIRELERQQRRQRQRIFDVEDEIKEKRDRIIEALEKRLSQRTGDNRLFTIRWNVT